MTQIEGIFIERNTQGIPRFVRIDLKKYGKRLMPFFKEIGVDKELSTYEKDDDSFFTPEMFAKIDESLKQAAEGKVVKTKSTEDLLALLDSL
jgi:hypothetical protein